MIFAINLIAASISYCNHIASYFEHVQKLTKRTLHLINSPKTYSSRVQHLGVLSGFAEYFRAFGAFRAVFPPAGRSFSAPAVRKIPPHTVYGPRARADADAMKPSDHEILKNSFQKMIIFSKR